MAIDTIPLGGAFGATRVLGIEDTDLITTIDFGQTLETMIAAGNYDWKNDSITARTFPVEGTGSKKFRNKLFRYHFGRGISSEDAVGAMKKAGFELPTHVHGLAFGATFPDEQRKYPIACLGWVVWTLGNRFVFSLGGTGTGRTLDLASWDGVWIDNWHFLGVQEISGA